MSPCKLALRNVKHYPGFDSLMEGSMAFEQECEVCYILLPKGCLTNAFPCTCFPRTYIWMSLVSIKANA